MTLLKFKNGTKQIGRKGIISLKHKINASPKIKGAILLLFKPFPKLKSRLKGIKTHRHTYMSICQIENPDQLSPYAREIYDALQDNLRPNRQRPERVK